MAAAVGRLVAAQQTARPCPPVREFLDANDLDSAYKVQRTIIDARIAAGARRVGHKIGLTNPNVQKQLGVDQPDFGVLLDDMQRTQDDPIDVRDLLQPKIEAEVAFILGADLDQADIDESGVLAATEHIVAAFEIVDSRIANWDISIEDTIADNGSSAMYVLGEQPVDPAGLDLPNIRMTMREGDRVVSTGLGADCLGNPLTAVAWLANKSRDYGVPLRAGDVILSGALGPMVPVEPGARFEAAISTIGTVRAAFTAGTGGATRE